MTPSYDPTTETRAETIAAKLGGRKRESSRTVTSQLWQKSGSCPKGTIPVLRIQKKDLLKSNSVGEYGRKKQPGFTNELTLGNDSENSYLQQANHSVCTLVIPFSCEYIIVRSQYMKFTTFSVPSVCS